MMLRIATVEDDTNDLEALRTHLKRYEKEKNRSSDVWMRVRKAEMP